MKVVESLVTFGHSKWYFKWFTVFTRILLAIGFIPSGMKKVLGLRFTQLGIDNPVGFFFEALYQAGFYWNFLGWSQVMAALLLLIPRTATLGAIIYLPIILNVFIITQSMGFKGTNIVTGLMLLACVYLLIWDYKKLKPAIQLVLSK